jgi:2-hydroxycyclohexanecarboxyl-CoA dehydrogenase
VSGEFSLTGQVAFVTGSGRGLGHAIARRLAELGAGVAVHDRDERAPAEYGEFANLAASHADIASLGVRTAVVTGDIGDEVRVRAMTAEVERALGPITILVNAAGGDIAVAGGKPKPNNALEIKMEDVYSTIKAAIVHYTRCLAAETREHNVRVNCVSPGATATARFKNTRALDSNQLVEEGTLVRYGAPRDQANAVAFLCSDAAKFIHGQVLRVDGGFSLFA